MIIDLFQCHVCNSVLLQNDIEDIGEGKAMVCPVCEHTGQSRLMDRQVTDAHDLEHLLYILCASPFGLRFSDREAR